MAIRSERGRAALAVILALLVLVGSASPAGAVTGGDPDNGAHPQVAFIMADLGDGFITFCSGSLIAPTVVLTAAHCTYNFDAVGVREVEVTFDDQVSAESTFYTSREWYSHPAYVDEEWPYTYDYGVVILRNAVDLPLATLPEEGVLDALIPEQGASDQQFVDVGYGQTGVDTGGGPPQPAFPLQRRQSWQTYHPGNNDLVGIGHGLTDLFLTLQANPSSRHGSGCGGDSGGPIFLADSYTVVAIHTGGYRLGFDGALCGRLSSLNHRLDTPEALGWLYEFI